MKYFIVVEDGEVVDEGEFVSMEETIQVGADVFGYDEGEEEDVEIEESPLETSVSWMDTQYILIGEKEYLNKYR